MKKLVATALIIVIGNFIYAQSPEIDRSYLLHKSRQQKTIATVAVVTGGTVALVGAYLWWAAPIAGLSGSGDGVEAAKRTGQTMVGIGGGMIAVSVPLFIASNKNKKKADLYVGTSQVNYLPSGSIHQLSVGIKFDLGN